MKRRRVKKNPAKLDGHAVKVWGIYAQKGTHGKRMHFDGQRFSQSGPVRRFKDKQSAASVARKLLSDFPILQSYRVTVASGWISARKRNPDSRAIERAAKLYEDFSGHPGNEVLKIREPDVKTALAVGELDFVGYTTVRDGEVEKYIHRFKKSSRPLLAASADGKALRIVGGRFQFTEAGIEDR